MARGLGLEPLPRLKLIVGQFAIVSESDLATLPDKIVIVIRQGWAFGDGSHPSTQNMLAELAKRVRAGMAVLDLGTGTGILAIAAARLGARVLATEADLPAYREAVANVAVNGVTDLVEVRRTAGEVPAGNYDMVLANLGDSRCRSKLRNAGGLVLLTDEDDNVRVLVAEDDRAQLAGERVATAPRLSPCHS